MKTGMHAYMTVLVLDACGMFGDDAVLRMVADALYLRLSGRAERAKVVGALSEARQALPPPPMPDAPGSH